ncbi:thioredoxin family protein [Mycoplasmopsis iners]|uniref:thioredoxin family protein n=1 Tax=Mycoplasmopsis iners TaxID=76630 RepID=UPI00068A0CA0|nr:thioredoxin domain-containing protein [Mycoplasmopsis iners]
MIVQEITQKEYEEEIANKEELYVLVFHATWCAPCKMFKITLDELAKTNNIPVYRVDVDKYPELTRKFGVMSMPTWFILKNKEVVQEGLGYMPYPTFVKEVEKHL